MLLLCVFQLFAWLRAEQKTKVISNRSSNFLTLPRMKNIRSAIIIGLNVLYFRIGNVFVSNHSKHFWYLLTRTNPSVEGLCDSLRPFSEWLCTSACILRTLTGSNFDHVATNKVCLIWILFCRWFDLDETLATHRINSSDLTAVCDCNGY